jgi:uncharacterized membrane protein HdeD (DUF308 family)
MRATLSTASRSWWVLVVTGVAWMLLSIIVFRFDYSSVQAISVLFGVLVLATAANEVLVGTLSSGGRRVLHLLLAAVFAVTGIVAFFRPGGTFVGLAAVVSFYLIFRGSFDIITAISDSVPGSSWLQVISGMAELLLGFWAAGSWGLSAVVLVAWVGAAAFLHGIAEIVGAFRLRDMAGRPTG